MYVQDFNIKVTRPAFRNRAMGGDGRCDASLLRIEERLNAKPCEEVEALSRDGERFKPTRQVVSKKVESDGYTRAGVAYYINYVEL